MFYQLFKLNNVETIENFHPRFVHRPKKIIKYNNIYYMNIDEEMPKYCDMNITYVTQNFYLFQKLRKMYSVRFLPYSVCSKVAYSKDIHILKKEKMENFVLQFWKTYNDKEDKLLPKYFINKDNLFTCNKLDIKLHIHLLDMNDIIFSIFIANEIYIINSCLKYTILDNVLLDICHFLNISYDNNEIDYVKLFNFTELNINNFNKILTLNESYVYDYIFGDKNIDPNMTYTEFLNSSIW